MLAVVYHRFQEDPTVQQLPDPQLSDRGVVLEVKATGICRSDWHGWMGHDPDIELPHVPGHEMCGEIVEKGRQVKGWEVGQRVTLPFVCGCGQCIYCLQGDPQVCDAQFQPGFTHWGSFAQFVHIDYAQHNLVLLPPEIENVAAAALGCRFATAFRALVDQAQLSAGQWLAVFGCGGVGLSAIMIAKALDAKIIAIDINQHQLQLATALGAEMTINPHAHADVSTMILDHTGGGVHITVDALGHPQIVHDCLKSLRKRGRHLQVGLMDPAEHNIPLPMDQIVARELEIFGSHGMQAYRYPQMLNLMSKGRLDPGRLVTNKITLGEAPPILMAMDSFENAGVTVITDLSR